MEREYALLGVERGKVKDKAGKLHRQFGHPTAVRLLKLLNDAGVKDKEFKDAVEEVSRCCEVCNKRRRPKPRPIVCLPLASRFNEMIAMDLKSWGNVYFLVMVDVATRYCIATVIRDKRAGTILRSMILHWIVIFGAPGKILTDNGGEFNNSEMRDFGENFNVKVLTTSAEAPWSNGVCERINAVIGDMVEKIMADGVCDIETALAWAVSSRNALTNYLGYAPNQLVFGMNPNLPSVETNKPPALGQVVASDVVRENLNALHNARKGFIMAESSEKLARALRFNIRANDGEDLDNGDEVYYKRKDSSVWHGPGTVIGRDGKLILVRHGGVFVRVHECRLSRVSPGGQGGDVGMSTQGVGETVNRVGVETVTGGKEESIESGGSPPVRGDDCDSDDSDDDRVDDVVEVQEDRGDGAEAQCGGGVDASRLKAGTRVRGTLWESDEVVTGSIVSRAGKAGGKFKDCYNIKWDADGGTSWADLGKHFKSWELVEDNVELLVFFNSDEVFSAKEKEIKNWNDNGVYDEVENVGQRALSVRWVITEKVKDGGKVVKARLVARGFEEETDDLRKDSPTCSKEAVRLAVGVSASMGWQCHSLDVKAAYLQGRVINRNVYLRPPPEFDDGKLWKLNKTVYGLCDAARHWYLRVRSQLLDFGVKVSSLDPALFYWSVDGVLEGILCVYVDDLFWAGTVSFERNVMDKLKEVFVMGNSESRAFKYVGLSVVSNEDGSVTLDQNQYAATLNPVSIGRQRSTMRTSELSDREKSEYRAALGQLNWIATHTRPDIAFDVSELSGLTNKATVSDMLRLNKVIMRVKGNGVKLCIPKLELGKCWVECFSDAAFGNLEGGGSQGGFVVFLHDDNGKRCPIYWQSRRIRRVVKSTLAAETLALLDCAEAAVYLVRILDEITGCGNLKVKCYVDSKSLVDTLPSCKGIEDRRLRIDIAVLRDMLERGEIGEVCWVDTVSQLADCLTKRGASTGRLQSAVGHQ